MIDKHIIDTHSLIWYLEGSSKLGKNAKIVMDNKTANLVLPVIALAEAFDIVQEQRTSIPDTAILINRIFGDPRFEIKTVYTGCFARIAKRIDRAGNARPLDYGDGFESEKARFSSCRADQRPGNYRIKIS